MELEKQTQTYLKPTLRRTVLQEETTETIVPDSSPDVERIVGTTGLPLLRSKEVRDGSVTISGGLRTAVLYIPEGESLPRVLEVYLPFVTKLEDPAIQQTDQVICSLRLRNLDARLINSRKLMLRANLAVSVWVYAQATQEVCIDAAGQPGLQVKTVTWPLNLAVSAGEKSFSVQDEMELPAGRPQMDELYWFTAQPELTETRMVGSRAVFKGSVEMHALYCSTTDVVEDWAFSMPISQFAEMPQAQEGDEVQVTLVLTGADVTLEGGQLQCSLQLLAQCLAFQRRNVTVIEDMYCLDHPLELQRQALELENRLDRQLLHQTVRQTVPADAQEVLSTQVSLETPELQQNGDNLELTAQALVSLLYRDAAGSLQGAAGKLQVQTQTQLAPGCVCMASVYPAGEIYTATAAEGLEVRFGACFELDCCAAQALEGISGAQVLEPTEQEDQPSIILRYVEPDQSLWEVAKACHTTVRAIQEANDLSTEQLSSAKLLLIPRAG